MPKKPNEKVNYKSKEMYQLLRGMKDIMPEDQNYWNFIRARVNSFAQAYSFQRIDLPILEQTSLFIRSVGEDTDIVEKEMYTFRDKSDESVTLRPEGTAGVARAYIEHGMLNRPQPVKMYYLGPFFRYDRPQAGRYRQFYQYGFEVLGDNHPVIDAQLMMMAYFFYSQMNIPVTLQVNSVGGPQCRTRYKKALADYYKTRKNSLCEDCKKRLLKNPLRLLDCKNPDCQLLAADAPQLVDYLSEEYHDHFVKVLEHLDALEISYVLNTRLVRGLDYYTGTVFEVWPTEGNRIIPGEGVPGEGPQEGAVQSEVKPSAQSALGGGGRYDLLVKTLGGPPTPAIGFAAGIERLVLEMKSRGFKLPAELRPDIFVAQLGDSARKKALKLFEELRQANYNVTESFSKDGLKQQMEVANRRQAKFALILGQKEIMDSTILIRDMESGLQETVDFSKVVPEIKKRLEKYSVVKVINNNRGANTLVPINE
ncbi:MAG: histidine--tRNA ligase [Patescibacteria group bacterium]|jgi:histidyl-tRNA synthetase